MVDQDAGIDQSSVEGRTQQSLLFTSEAALSVDEARTLTGRRGATLVLLVGEVGTGKTTLLVELWSLLLLRGSISNHSIAGSRTALAFEERAYHSRVESAADVARTIRTHESEGGFLHLRVQRPDGLLRELLFADITGEHFERIREGTALLDELSWVARVDRFLVIVDGKGYATPGEREVILNRARRQIFALRSSQSVSSTARVAIALTKLDELSEDDRDSYSEARELLVADVRSVDDEATSLLIAARPADETSARGLDGLIEWLCSDDRLADRVPDILPSAASRAIGRFAS